MSRRRTAVAIGTAAALAVLAAAAPLPGMAETTASHCAAEEKILFNCSTGAKTVSVCATSPLSAEAGSVQYRFGPPGAPELRYPPSPDGWRKVTRGGVLTL